MESKGFFVFFALASLSSLLALVSLPCCLRLSSPFSILLVPGSRREFLTYLEVRQARSCRCFSYAGGPRLALLQRASSGGVGPSGRSPLSIFKTGSIAYVALAQRTRKHNLSLPLLAAPQRGRPAEAGEWSRGGEKNSSDDSSLSLSLSLSPRLVIEPFTCYVACNTPVDLLRFPTPHFDPSLCSG